MSNAQDLSEFRSEHSIANRIARAAWGAARLLLFRPTPRPMHAWRCFVLRCFGARIGRGVRVYASAKIWAPWNLTMGDFSVLGDEVDCYTVDQIEIGAHAVVSQYAHLCAATHDIDKPHFPLVTKPIRLGPRCWIAAGAFIGPGVTVGEGAVVGARAVVTRPVAAHHVVAGNPARTLRIRSSAA